ncbi:MAG: hypothetical protein HY814_12440 [Candidatus Riflebacteria bacterium]|nr:hypothetical protein [Candidatus Riflebacteria bacterium]
MNRPFLFSLLLGLALLVPSFARAQDDSGPAAPGDADEALVGQVLSLYQPEDAGKPQHVSATRLVRRVMQAWDRLSEESREKLKPYVLMPGQEQPGDTPSAPGQDEFKYAKTQHFLVFWKTEGLDAVRAGDQNRNGFPDYVERVGAFMEQAYQKEVVEMGFQQPPSCPQYRVYLKGLNHNGLTHTAGGAQTWIEVNANIEAYTRRTLGAKFGPQVSADPQGIESGLLKAVCAHEFFHAIQANYSFDQPDWFAEGSAEWMGEMVFPESDFYLNNLPLHFQQPHVSLFSSDLWFEYSASVFTGFLMENLGGPALLKRIWEACRKQQAGAAIQQICGDFRELFTAFWCYNALRAYKDGAKYPQVEAVEVKQFPFTMQSGEIAEPQYYGANLFRLSGLDPARPLKLAIVPRGGSLLGAKLIAIDPSTKKWKIVRLAPGADGSLNSVAPPAQQAVLVIGNFTKDKKGSYTLTASY